MFNRLLFAAFVGGFALLASGVEIEGQTKTRKRRTPPAPATATQAQTQTEPVIISRAEDFPDPDLISPVPETKVVDATKPTSDSSIDELRMRVQQLELGKNDSDEKSKRLLLNLDVLSRAEQRSDSLRKQLFEMIEKENGIKLRLDQIEGEIRPESIDRTVAFAGSLRPEEIRSMKKKSLEIERSNLVLLMGEVQKARTTLDQTLQKSDFLVERLRQRFEKEIDLALSSDEKP